jgi:SAM-dependent methyltransferase
LKERLRRLLKRSKWAVVANFVVRNRRARRSVETDIHGQSRGLSVSESVDYVERAFEAIMGHGRLSPADIEGKRVLELGPGDNLGLALRFLAAGARQVVTLDKFAVLRDPGVEQEIYRSLLARLSPKEQARCGSAVCFGERTSFDDERLRPVSGVGVEEALTILEPESFDLIVSVAVLEHVYNPDASFAAMDRLLKPGGRMLHQVDFRDHEMFSGAGHHPLTFLTVPQRIWRGGRGHGHAA